MAAPAAPGNSVATTAPPVDACVDCTELVPTFCVPADDVARVEEPVDDAPEAVDAAEKPPEPALPPAGMAVW